MHRTLFTIPLEAFGVPLFGPGLLTGLWVAAAIALLVLSARRGENGWNLLQQGAIAGVVALALFLLPQWMSEGIRIRGYGTFLVLGCGAGMLLTALRAQRMGVHTDAILSLCFWMIVMGVVSARLFFVVQYWPQFAQPTWQGTLQAVLSYASGGLVVYGALIGGAATFFVFCWKKSLPPLALADLFAPGVAIGIALGRLGCLMNGCCYGGTCDLPIAVRFPADSPVYAEQLASGELLGLEVQQRPDAPPKIVATRPGSIAAKAGLPLPLEIRRVNGLSVPDARAWQAAISSATTARDGLLRLEPTDGRVFTLPLDLPATALPVHPTQVYSSLHAFALCGVLWFAYPFRRRDGQILALLMTLYPVGRFLLEAIRVDEAAIGFSGLTISQWISVFTLAGAALLWAWLQRRPPGSALPAASNALGVGSSR